MLNRDRIIPVATVLLIGMVVAAPLIGQVDGQILTEKTYYEEDFEQYSDTAVQLVPDSELQNQYLTNTGAWSYGDAGSGGNIRYGSPSAHRHTGHLDTSQPWLSAEFRSSYDDRRRYSFHRNIDVPENMTNPVLVVEHATYHQRGEEHEEIAVYDKDSTEKGKVLSTRNHDGNPAYILGNTLSDVGNGDFVKVGYLERTQNRGWQTNMFEVSPDSQNVTVYKATTVYDNNNRERGAFEIRNLYWVDASDQSHQTSIEGYESIPEDDSFGGPDPYPLVLANEPTAEGKETSIRSRGSEITREFNLSDVSTKPEKVYFEIDVASHSNSPVNWRIEQYGQEVASGTIDAGSSAQATSEIDLKDDEFTLYVNSDGNYEVKNVRVVALQETTQGDPLASQGPIVLDAGEGYDRTVGAFISLLDITTTTLLYIVMIALAIGAVVFSYTKSVRSQEFGQSLMFGAMVAGIVVVGMVPTMNLATWIFTGDTQRAPLANPSLEAEPPTYYSTEYQAGTMDGWTNPVGQARPVSVGESFNLEMSGQPAMVQRKVHISLGNSLDTGFVRLGAFAKSTPGYTSNPHETSVRIRVYVTDGEDPTRVPPSQDVTGEDLSTYEDLVVAEEWARSFDGQVVNEEGTVTFPLEGDTIFVEVVATSNRNDELAQGGISWIGVGATTEGTGEAAGGH